VIQLEQDGWTITTDPAMNTLSISNDKLDTIAFEVQLNLKKDYTSHLIISLRLLSLASGLDWVRVSSEMCLKLTMSQYSEIVHMDFE
jgi:hypothetical protein